MKLPNWLKIVWWFLLVGFFIYLFVQRYEFIMSGSVTAADIVIFLILIALITIPLFQEVDFFGVRLKKEIDDLKTEFKEQIINLRSDIQNTINMRTEISPHINVLAPSPDSELLDLGKTIKPILEETLRGLGIVKPVPVIEELDVPDNAVFLFQVRYAIDNELRRITYSLWLPPDERRYPASLRVAISLSDRGIIVPAAIDSIREIYAICSKAVHGEEVSEASVKFVKDMSSPLLPYLKSIKPQPPPWMLPWMQQQPPSWPGKPKKE